MILQNMLSMRIDAKNSREKERIKDRYELEIMSKGLKESTRLEIGNKM